MTNGLLSGKNVIITGASRGLGMQTAHKMWQAGANLLLIARSETALIDLQNNLMNDCKGGQQAHILPVDLGTVDAISAIMAKAENIWNQIDVLVNNAAIPGPIGELWNNDWEAWQATIRVNLLAPVELCRSVVPWMRRQERGKIINLSGGGATGPRPRFSAYATAKTGLVRFSEVLSQEVVDFHIDVNCIAPGAMNTEMLRAVVRAGPDEAGDKEYAVALEQADQENTIVERAADLCVFLASQSSDGITGKIISAVWDSWANLQEHASALSNSDVYTLRRIVPKDRGMDWG